MKQNAVFFSLADNYVNRVKQVLCFTPSHAANATKPWQWSTEKPKNTQAYCADNHNAELEIKHQQFHYLAIGLLMVAVMSNCAISSESFGVLGSSSVGVLWSIWWLASSCKLSFKYITTSERVGLLLALVLVQLRAKSMTFRMELILYCLSSLESMTSVMSAWANLERSHCNMWPRSGYLSTGGRPVTSSRRTTPKLYTSLFSVSWKVLWYLKQLVLESNLVNIYKQCTSSLKREYTLDLRILGCQQPPQLIHEYVCQIGMLLIAQNLLFSLYNCGLRECCCSSHLDEL